MSNEHSSLNNQPSDQSITLFLQDNDGEKLTDILVEALYEAFRILEDELKPETLH
jgi:hypothetical protein